MPYKDKNRQQEYVRLWRRSHKQLKNCEYCGKEYAAWDKGQRFCSFSCSGKFNHPKQYLDIPDCLESASRKIDKTLGYVRVYAPMHPEANTWGYVYEHRLIAEQLLGRRLEQDEVVHHKNGLRYDNSIENLEVMNKVEHGRLNKALKQIGDAALL